MNKSEMMAEQIRLLREIRDRLPEKEVAGKCERCGGRLVCWSADMATCERCWNTQRR